MKILIFIILLLSANIYSKPNVIIILTDDMGWGDVSYHGGHIPTPNIDALAGTQQKQVLFVVRQEHHC